MSHIVNGKKIAQEIKESLGQKISQYKLGEMFFDIVYVGSDPVIDNFIKYKKVFGEDLGIGVRIHNLPSDINQEEVLIHLDAIQKKSQAVIIQLPLPKHLDQKTLLNYVHPRKDVDVLGIKTQAEFIEKDTSFFPPVAGSIIYILERNNIILENKKILLIGNGALVGYPMSLWLDKNNYRYDVIVKDSDLKTKQRLISEADIIISGAGVPGLVTQSMVKEGVVLIDAGTSESGKKVIGDIHPDCAARASLMTPVPGGIGPITIAVLYQNIIKAYIN